MINKIEQKSHLELKFEHIWVSNYPQIDLVSQAQLIPKRKFKFDYYHPQSKVTIEIQGGRFMRRGGHNSPAGVKRDCEKTTLATLYGFHPIVLCDAQITEEWIHKIVQFIKERTI